MTSPEHSASTPAPKPASVWEDFVDIFVSPAEVYARRERGSIVVPLLVLTVVLAGLYFATRNLLEPVYELEMRRGLEAAMRGRNLTPEQIEQSIQQGRGIAQATAAVGAVVGIPIAVFLIGLVTWLAGKLFGARQTFHAAIIVATYAYFPRILESVVNAVQGLLLDVNALTSVMQLKLGPTRFMSPEDNPLLFYLLARVDVFTIWVTVLIAIGLRVTGKLSSGQAAAAAAIVWLLGALPALQQARALSG